ncbi:hypothetical protein FOY51_26745 [Antrihabitans cavernicola]|uniref:Uncharacterized protein n=1 Tax=Antrihabitans cavernicola TaxID=2495913 RepID=A0A5A7S3C4_9NOCA|nr:hypothetical protein FOY51_26745 [Spelaeibacter cavernicola]
MSEAPVQAVQIVTQDALTFRARLLINRAGTCSIDFWSAPTADKLPAFIRQYN